MLSVTLLKKTKTALLVPNALIIATVTDRVSTVEDNGISLRKYKTEAVCHLLSVIFHSLFPRIHSTRGSKKAESGGACRVLPALLAALSVFFHLLVSLT